MTPILEQSVAGRLREALESELSSAIVLRNLLSRESSVLREWQPEELAALTREKETAIIKLQTASQRRIAITQALGQDGGLETLIEGLGHDDGNEPLGLLCQHLKSELEACMELNRQNEILNRSGQRRVHAVLRLLSGQPGEPLTYEDLAGKGRPA